MVSSQNSYVTLNVASDPLSEDVKPRNIRRWWNSLFRFQQNLICIFIIGTCFLTFYVIVKRADNSVIGTESQADVTVSKGPPISFADNADARRDSSINTISHVLEQPEVGSHNNAVERPQPVQFTGPTNEQQTAVVNAFKHAWAGYKRYAWGHDHLKPLTMNYHDWFGLGLTLVDSIDTMYMMNLQSIYEESRNWIDKSLNFDIDRDVNLFEVTIRVLGGLLSIYHLTGDEMYRQKAIDLGDRLLPSFNTQSGVPYVDINLHTKIASPPKWTTDSSTSEVSSLQLEFRDLSRVSGNRKYEDAVSKVSLHLHNLEKKNGLVPIFINPRSGQFRYYSTITLGARGDSYYEYLLKQWIQTGRTIDYLRDDYIEAIKGVETQLVKRTISNGYLFIGELLGDTFNFKNKMDHLTCYLPGTLALGVHFGMPNSHLKLAEELIVTCYQTYAQQPTFLAPEITYFNIWKKNASDIYVKRNDVHNLLRPEFVETLWYMYQLTQNATYQEMGWKIFEAFEKYTKVTNGYTSINNVQNPDNVRPRNMMESFFLAETLKYFYLLFSDNPKLLDLDKYVINTEAHPLPIYKS